VPASTELRVRYSETDKMGVVYYANYLIWCEVARTEFIRHHGASYAEWEAGGVLLAVSEARLRYHRSARYDDLVRIDCYLTEVGSRGVAFEYRIVLAADGSRLVSAYTSLVAIDPAGRPVKLSAEVRERLQTVQEAPPAR
jgi:acyl-CoA thioester hydrolase